MKNSMKKKRLVAIWEDLHDQSSSDEEANEEANPCLLVKCSN